MKLVDQFHCRIISIKEASRAAGGNDKTTYAKSRDGSWSIVPGHRETPKMDMTGLQKQKVDGKQRLDQLETRMICYTIDISNDWQFNKLFAEKKKSSAGSFTTASSHFKSSSACRADGVIVVVGILLHWHRCPPLSLLRTLSVA